uniref:RRM domain-containing protein n=1 Tax=Callorhinchus milii TaxID=7868 RepID=A0A4W3GE37_CALMI
MATDVIQVTNVSPSATSEQMKTLFTFLGKIDELRLFPSDESPLPVTSRVCFVKFHEADSVGVAQHLTNTVFIDRALIVVPYTEGLCSFCVGVFWSCLTSVVPISAFFQ